jgi:hypothetical protein
MATYHDVFESTLALYSVGRWSGFGGMTSSAASSVRSEPELAPHPLLKMRPTGQKAKVDGATSW